MDPVYL